MSKRQRSILLLIVAIALFISAVVLTLFVEDVALRVVGVVALLAAIPCAIAGGRGLRSRSHENL